ncbi:MAG: Wzz/FepE/Etk N-terminal domain-containing protein [Corynebacterium sp.]|uniref:Wzz/FepE/Etk N-terminal domain-containing protein n=1 Tax=Corynebacterium sp. TaxID=1720 RepID=UPI0026DF2E84|nr:Wzz/FepE/Etk N-terminal domain-containing protein [Corynebacterium sp.]MDO5670284.1 Wzz/FepE/Etk N-terminal domain-containing protein [Corynebacterium sp.]
MNADNPESSLDVAVVSRIVRQRKKWIVLGTVIGIVCSLAYLLLAPTTYTATARVSITALGAEPIPEGRSLSSVLDIPTERQLAASALTTADAATTLGDGWTAGELSSGLSVAGDPTSTVLALSYTDTDRARAIEGADALASSYLTVRSTMVAERVRGMRENIADRLTDYEEELEELRTSGLFGPATQVRTESIESGIMALQQRLAALEDPATEAGQVISPAASTPQEQSPVVWRVIALGILAGLVLGLVLAVLRHTFDRVARNPEDIRDILGVRLLRPQAPYGEPERWAVAATLAHHQRGSEQPLMVLTDEGNADALAAAGAIAATGRTVRVNLGRDRAEVLADLVVGRHAVVIIPPTWTKADLDDLREDIASMGTQLIGALVAEERAAMTTAGR